MEKEYYDFLSSMMNTLFSTDDLFTYDYLVAELHISRTALSMMKQGGDMSIHQYVRVTTLILETIHLTVQMSVLLVMIKKAIATHSDLVIATVPHQAPSTFVPQDYMRFAIWEDVRV